jgi:hypothetical protein
MGFVGRRSCLVMLRRLGRGEGDGWDAEIDEDGKKRRLGNR